MSNMAEILRRHTKNTDNMTHGMAMQRAADKLDEYRECLEKVSKANGPFYISEELGKQIAKALKDD